MHRSRIGVVMVDQPAEHIDAATTFWAEAHGAEPRPVLYGPEFRSLGPLAGGILLATQQTGSGTPGRVHLDIETDDVTAEVQRLTALGATVVDDSGEHAVMTDPGGVVFCVVPVETGADFETHATTWE